MVSPTIRVPKEKFSETFDPADHAATFESHMDFYGVSNATKCWAFSVTFRGVARSWYDSLPAYSITSFKYFKKLFIGNFMVNKRWPKKKTSLWSISQGPNETLERYTERFTVAYSCVTNPNEEFDIQVYVVGVANESVQLVLCSNDVESMESLINKAYKLFDMQEMSRNWTPRIQQNDQRRIDNDCRGGHHKEAGWVIDQSHQGNSSIGSLRATHHWQSKGHKS